jgi:hypothetical protein
MKYQPLLSEVKKFLNDTRIIEWCIQCKGYCCGDKTQSLEESQFFYCQSLEDCNNRLVCKIHICSGLLDYLFCGKEANDYQKVIDYINDEINKGLMITYKHIKQVDSNSIKNFTIRQRAWKYPYKKEMDEIEFDDAKIKFIFKINREKISQKMNILLVNGDNLQCSKKRIDDNCEGCAKFNQCGLYLVKKERIKELAVKKSVFAQN